MNGVSVCITFKKSLTETETGLLEISIIVEARMYVPKFPWLQQSSAAEDTCRHVESYLYLCSRSGGGCVNAQA